MVHCCCFHDANQSVMRASRSLSVLSFARPPARTLAAAARAPTRAHTQNEPSQKSKRAPRSASRCGAIVTSREDANARDACASTRRTCAHQTPPFALTGVLSTRPTRAATQRSIAKFFFVVSISAGRTRSERARRGFAARASTYLGFGSIPHTTRGARRAHPVPRRAVSGAHATRSPDCGAAMRSARRLRASARRFSARRFRKSRATSRSNGAPHKIIFGARRAFERAK